MQKITIPKEFNGNIFITSDHHFNHFNIIKYCNRPFSNIGEMNNTLVNNWNSVVTDKDIVFHLGDFCFGDRKEWRKWINQLSFSQIHLIQGNHDRLSDIPSEMFSSVNDMMMLTVEDEELDSGKMSLFLCHYCMVAWPGQWRGVTHCFGHSHTSPYSNKQKDVDYIGRRPLPSYDVGVDNNNFTPVSYDELKIIFTQQLLYGK